MRHVSSRTARIAVLAIGVVLLAALVPAALADDIAESKGFRKAVTVAGIREHQTAFQAHADANGGNRVAGSAGYEASANYVVARMTAAGYVGLVADVLLRLQRRPHPGRARAHEPDLEDLRRRRRLRVDDVLAER